MDPFGEQMGYGPYGTHEYIENQHRFIRAMRSYPAPPPPAAAQHAFLTVTGGVNNDWERHADTIAKYSAGVGLVAGGAAIAPTVVPAILADPAVQAALMKLSWRAAQLGILGIEFMMPPGGPSVCPGAIGGSSGSRGAVNATVDAAADAAGQGFRFFGSFGKFKRAMGAAGEGKVWHHLVEQRPSNVAQFGEEAIHNTMNVRAAADWVNKTLAGYYNSIRPFTDGMRLRKWLDSKSWREQYEFGKEALEKVLSGQPLP